MEIQAARIRNNSETTIGGLLINWGWGCAFLEDGPDKRIQAGRYEIKLRKELSPLTEKYRKIYDWFEWHLELQEVPGRDFIYIHHGNTHEDTLGCLVVGQESDGWMVTNSRNTFKDFCNQVYPAIYSGEKVFITIIDEK